MDYLAHLPFLLLVVLCISNQGELLRWLSESVWFPTNLLPSKNLKWTAIDDTTAKLTFDYKGLSLFYIVTVNTIGEIVQMETKRYMDEKRLETWIIKPDKYEEKKWHHYPNRGRSFLAIERRRFQLRKV